MEGLSAICAGLGAIEEDENDNRIGYATGEHCSDNLKDLLRFLRRDDPQTREVFKQVCKWNIVGKDLLPIIEYCLEDRNLVLSAVKVLVFLTMPIEPSSMDIPQQMEDLWGIKSSITLSDVVPVIMSLLESPLENLERESFTEDDWKLVQLVVTLFRNILAIQDISPHQKAGASASQFLFLRDKFLELLFRENVMDVILVLSQHMGGTCRYLHHDKLLLLEIFYFIFMGQEPELIIKAYSKSSQVDEVVESSVNSLREIMAEEHEKRRLLRQRNLVCYSQFSGTFTRLTADGSKTLLKGNPSVSHEARLKAHKNNRGPIKRTAWDHVRLPSTTNKILELLYDFINQFLEGGYNVLMHSVREDIEKEHHSIQNSDVLIFIQVAQFVISFQYHKFLNKHNTGAHTESPVNCDSDDTLLRGSICGPIAESLNESMFQLVTHKWRYAFHTLKETNDYKFLSTAGSFMKTMLLMLDLVLKQSPEDSKENQTTRILLYKLFYDQTEEGMTQFILNQIKSFDNNKQKKSYLADLLETMSIVLQLMERLQACGMLRVSKKLRKRQKKKATMDGKKVNDGNTFPDATTVQNDQEVSELSDCKRRTSLDHVMQGDNAIPSEVDEPTVLGADKRKIDETVADSNAVQNDIDGLSNERPVNIDTLNVDDESSEQKNTNETFSDFNNGTNDCSGEEEGDDDDGMRGEVDLKVSALVSAIASNSVVHNFCWLLKFYKTNSAITNNSIIHMLQRICNDLELSPMLYQLSLLTIFYDILEEQKLKPCKEYESIVLFLTTLVRRMLRKMKSYPLLFIEVLFWKTRKECCYINCESMLNDLSSLRKSSKGWSSFGESDLPSSDRQGWPHRSIADALGDDEADFVFSHEDSVRDKTWGTEGSRNQDFNEEDGHNFQYVSDVEICADENFGKEDHCVDKEIGRVPKRRKLSVLGYELKEKVKELYEKYKDQQHCDRLIAEALDPNGKVLPLQVSRALKHLGLKIPRRKRIPSSASAPNQFGDLASMSDGNIGEKESSVRRSIHNRKRVQAFSEEQEQKIKALFEQYKDQKRCSQMIADALGSEGTFSAAKISRKLKQLGLFVPKKRKSSSNLHLRDEAITDKSDDETLLSMKTRSKKQLKGDAHEERQYEPDDDEELLCKVVKKMRKKSADNYTKNSTGEDFANIANDKSSRVEYEENIKTGVDGSSSENESQLLEVIHERLDDDVEGDDVPTASSNKNAEGSRKRRFRMAMIDLDEEE
ncbi:unnamed protein product [Cuscuta europaea]|uniref:Timeless N-terminal domain-containing protein n=1 Tax=Cuscuta europaea TaxID=41803 RepID=A0A9P1E0P4_CUSEU|nr:unnamed protein product [Cuscuta europaea]